MTIAGIWVVIFSAFFCLINCNCPVSFSFFLSITYLKVIYYIDDKTRVIFKQTKKPAVTNVVWANERTKKNENIGYWLVGTNVPRDKQTKTNRKTSILLLLLSFVVCRNNHVNIVVVVIIFGVNQIKSKISLFLFAFTFSGLLITNIVIINLCLSTCCQWLQETKQKEMRKTFCFNSNGNVCTWIIFSIREIFCLHTSEKKILLQKPRVRISSN